MKGETIEKNVIYMISLTLANGERKAKFEGGKQYCFFLKSDMPVYETSKMLCAHR